MRLNLGCDRHGGGRSDNVSCIIHVRGMQSFVLELSYEVAILQTKKETGGVRIVACCKFRY